MTAANAISGPSTNVHARTVLLWRTLRTEFLATDMTVGAALQKMTDTAADAMSVRDTDGRPAGIVEREDVLARFLLDATRGD